MIVVSYLVLLISLSFSFVRSCPLITTHILLCSSHSPFLHSKRVESFNDLWHVCQYIWIFAFWRQAKWSTTAKKPMLQWDYIILEQQNILIFWFFYFFEVNTHTYYEWQSHGQTLSSGQLKINIFFEYLIDYCLNSKQTKLLMSICPTSLARELTSMLTCNKQLQINFCWMATKKIVNMIWLVFSI